jgi:type IX secretion system PorP/SprF family membrane protein
MMLARLLSFSLLFFCVQGYAQDLHFSQFYHNPLNLTPAATGVHNSNVRASGLYRSQWASVPVSYQSFSGSVDWKAITRGSNILGLGFLLQHDQAGDAKLRWTQVGATLSVVHALGAQQGISAGFGLALVQRSFDISGLTFKNQWTGDLFDHNLPSKEQFGNNSGIKPSFSAGLMWFLQSAGNRNNVKVGVGAHHLNKPAINFSDDLSFRLPVRVTINAECTLQTSDLLDIVAFAAAQQLSTSRELIAGAGLRRILVSSPGENLAVRATMALRVGDALIPAVQLERNNWVFGLSYDWNISKFDIATTGRGGFELAAVYQILPAPPVKSFKTCPVF